GLSVTLGLSFIGVRNLWLHHSSELRQRLFSRRRVSTKSRPQQCISTKRGIGRVFCVYSGQLMLQITLPDGSSREFPGPVTVNDVASSIGAGLGRAALAGRVGLPGQEPKLVDTSYVIGQDAQLAIVTAKDPEGVDLIRHSTAHLLAYAVKELFPDAQVT